MNKHSTLVKECDDLVRKIMKLLNDGTCGVCGKHRSDLGVMHILGKQAHPALRWTFLNLIYAGWNCCHRPYDQEPKKRPIIERLLAEKLGHDYQDKLIHMEQILPKKTPVENIRKRLSVKLESLGRVFT